MQSANIARRFTGAKSDAALVNAEREVSARLARG